MDHERGALSFKTRPAVASDLPAINEIYNHYVASSACTYQEEPESLKARRAWFARHGPDHPVLVADAGGRVVGWAALSPFHSRSAYRRTVESSIYVHHEHRGLGVGSTLMQMLLASARGRGHHTIVALIDAGQAGSIALHRAVGFVEAGRLREVGRKFGQWLDVIYMQKMWRDPVDPPSSPADGLPTNASDVSGS